eukprot:CAMPEP_0194726632 /NCGR_PEP_ID=MMETSP0296-20130528/31591_1 /TAXON_ID=39354 /ORGANISM="Heterosigma akashiwo, Strain CCMP2393" /LENGTH=189 /DNA_ID=CAMNT_0039631687 /DNA_START=181 /DNA_END=749 /DNA_ORIENTATION=-
MENSNKDSRPLSVLNTGEDKGTTTADLAVKPEDAVPAHAPVAKQLSTIQKLKNYGLAGMLGYGLLNFAYYSVALCVAWVATRGGTTFLPAAAAAGGGGSAALASPTARFAKVFGLVWAGSQVTKAARAWGALGLAPAVDRGLEAAQRRLRVRSKAAAFWIGIGMILCGFALVASGLILSAASTAAPRPL